MSAGGEDRILASVMAQLGELVSDEEPDFVRDLVRIYLGEAQRQIEEIREGVEKNNATAVAESAHSLKSASANLGLEELAGLSKQLEDAGRAGRLTDAGAIRESLEKHFREVSEALSGFVAEA